MNYITKGERMVDAFKEHCPVTSHLLDQSIGKENLMTDTPFSYTFFSTMKPGTQIAPHHGACNIKLRCHFPIFIPADQKAYLRVGHETRGWNEGEMLTFDDTYEHEAGNLSQNEERVVLLIDIWHPDLDNQERQAIKNMFQEVKNMVK